MPKRSHIIVSLVAAICAVAGASVAAVLLASGGDSTRSTSPATVPPVEASAPPQVLELAPDTVLVVHESDSGATRFDQGVVWVDLALDDSIFRWIEGGAVADGGRQTVERAGASLALLPVGLHVVVSYDLATGPVSIYGTLGGTATLADAIASYPVVVYDAPGDGSTYTLSGSYDIPEQLVNVRVVVSGQAVRAGA